MFYALRVREAKHFCVLGLGAFSCIFHWPVLLSGQDPLNWTPLGGVVFLFVCVCVCGESEQTGIQTHKH